MDYQDQLKQNYRHFKSNKYFYLSLTLLTISIFILFAIRPSVTQAITTYRDLQQLKTLQSQLELKKQELQRANEIISQNPLQIELIKTALPKDPLQTQIASDVYLMATKNNMSLLNIRFTNEQNKSGEAKKDTQQQDPDIANLYFEINLMGKYQDLFNFIADYSNYIRAGKITNIRVNENKEYKGQLINIAINGEAYYKLR